MAETTPQAPCHPITRLFEPISPIWVFPPVPFSVTLVNQTILQSKPPESPNDSCHLSNTEKCNTHFCSAKPNSSEDNFLCLFNCLSPIYVMPSALQGCTPTDNILFSHPAYKYSKMLINVCFQWPSEPPSNVSFMLIIIIITNTKKIDNLYPTKHWT